MGTPDFVLDLRKDVGHKELFLPGVTCVVIRRQHENGAALGEPEVLLVQRSDNGWWSAVSGILEPGDSPASGALREVQEETGSMRGLSGWLEYRQPYRRSTPTGTGVDSWISRSNWNGSRELLILVMMNPRTCERGGCVRVRCVVVRTDQRVLGVLPCGTW